MPESKKLSDAVMEYVQIISQKQTREDSCWSTD